jgi:Fe2+ or Zn2+ uptake regulation protein
MGRLKKSDLRESILELLKNTETHPTASWVFDHLRKEFPRVAVGTVYRNLNILVSEGLVKSINFDEPIDRYDAKLTKHYHFICERCGTIHDLDIPIDRSLEDLVMKKTGFQVLRHRLDFFGVCPACRE